MIVEAPIPVDDQSSDRSGLFYLNRLTSQQQELAGESEASLASVRSRVRSEVPLGGDADKKTQHPDHRDPGADDSQIEVTSK